MTFEEFITKFNITLDDNQNVAVQATEGSVLLLAVPGSGKTTVLVTRLGYMLYCKHILPENILTMTYTVAATIDMKNRYSAFFGDEYRNRLEFRTINGFCAKVILFYEKMLGRKAFELITDEKESYSILAPIYKEYVKEYPTENSIKELSTKITYAKNMLLNDEEIKNLDETSYPFYDMYKSYNTELKKQKKMDYDDQMIYAFEILKRYPQILDYYQEKYKYICVDEAQDTSKIQHAIVSLLAKKYQNVFMVGDEDQSIYGFRAAYPEALMDFKKIYKDAKILMLENNYRSTANIVHIADKFIKKNEFRYDKNMKPTRPNGDDVQKIRLKNQLSQYEYIVSLASNCKSKTAVLYRDNECALPIIDLLERKKIPYDIKLADTTFFTNRAVQDVIDIIRFSLDPYDTEIFMRIYYKLNLYLTKQNAINACKISAFKKIAILDAACQIDSISDSVYTRCRESMAGFRKIATDRADNAISRIHSSMGYGEYMHKMGIGVNKINILRALGKQELNVSDFLKRLDKLCDIIREKERDQNCNFTMTTIHSSKGLEYDNVYLIDVYDSLFPEKVIDRKKCTDSDVLHQFEEERRLFYVGMTRAKNKLCLLTYDDKKSTFINDIFQSHEKIQRRATTTNFNKYNSNKNAIEYKKFQEKMLIGATIMHKAFGEGMIINRLGDIVTVQFEQSGTKKLFVKSLYSSNLIKVE